MSAAREQILAGVRSALGRAAGTPIRPVPQADRVAPRVPADPDAEATQLLAEIDKIGGVTRRLDGPAALLAALAELVEREGVRRATLWETEELRALGVAAALADLGVTVVPPDAGHDALASCDLGVTGADGALPETGTLLLRSSPERPRLVSLLPRVHLALLGPNALRADLRQAFAAAGEGYFVLISGPSRTADIELTLTIGVHGPAALYAWYQG
jgi:L-lactate dehydrogenase complex protein LldG